MRNQGVVLWGGIQEKRAKMSFRGSRFVLEVASSSGNKTRLGREPVFTQAQTHLGKTMGFSTRFPGL